MMFDGKKANIVWFICMIVGGVMGAGWSLFVTWINNATISLWIPGLLFGLTFGSMIGQFWGLNIEEERVDKKRRELERKND